MNPDPTKDPIAAAASRKCIMVSGMHRSGTSALTRVLSLLGATLPKHVMGEGPSNEKGHWEPERLVAVHDEMLIEARTSWDDWRAFDPAMLSSERLLYYKTKLVRIVLEEYGDASLFVVKDPRMCRLMPLWWTVLAQVDAQPCVTIAFRHPLEVARSLHKRDALSLAHSCLFWLRDVLDVERDTRGTPRVFVSYDDMLRNPVRTGYRVMSQFLEDRSPVNQDIEREIAAFVDPELRHHVAQLGELREPKAFYPWLREVYNAHIALSRCPTDEKAQHQLDRIRAAFDLASASFAPLFVTFREALTERDEKIAKRDRMVVVTQAALSERDQTIVLIDQQLAAVETALSERDQTIALFDQKLAAVETALSERDQTIALLDQKLAAVETALSERDQTVALLDQKLATVETTVGERDERIAMLDQTLAARARAVGMLQQEITDRDGMLADRMAKLAQREAAIRALQASTSWRVTAPLRALRKLLAPR